MAGLMSRIEQNRSRFSKSQNKIANYITTHYDKAAFMTAIKLGEAVGVSESTVVRFAYLVGMDGYPELQTAMQEMMRNHLTMAQRLKMTVSVNESKIPKTVLKNNIANLRHTQEVFDEDIFRNSVHEICEARKIYVFGTKNLYAVASFLKDGLNYIHDNCILIDSAKESAFEDMVDIGPYDVCIAFGFPRISALFVEIIHFAKSKGAKIISVTDSAGSSVGVLSDFVLLSSTDNMTSFMDSCVGPLCIADMLIASTAKKRSEEAMDRISALEQVWSKNDIFLKDNSTEKRK